MLFTLMSSKAPVNIMWFRRDLRLHDNAALYHALKSENPVVPVFVFDKNILDALEDENDLRVEFIHIALQQMQQQLEKMGCTLDVYYDTPINAYKKIISKYQVGKVFTNHDYELYAIERDAEIKRFLNDHQISFHAYKDQVIFEKNEVVKDDGNPYTVFTSYSRKWKAKIEAFYYKGYPAEKYFNHFYHQKPIPLPSLHSIGFKETGRSYPLIKVDDNLIKNYAETRNYPGEHGTTRLSVHLRFGTTSIRELASHAQELNTVFLNELIWRDFYNAITFHFPHICKGQAFKKQYDYIKWRNNEKEFEAWCAGKTGYPIVDAGMRELNETGFMHNRVRMITASFLAKHLLIDWRWGEAYFAKKLLDFDFAANNGGWQWAAGTGCDAAPYFRIFNPKTQTEKFDKNHHYINKWVSELNSFDYPTPIVEHQFARERCLAAYKKALNEK